MVCRIIYSAACGIFPDQGSNPCLLHWQVDSLPLNHQGSPGKVFLRRERERAECLKTSKRILIYRVNNKCNYRKLVVTSDLKLQVTSLWGNFPCWNFASHFFSSSISLPEASCSQILVAQSCMPGTQNLRGFTWLTKNPNQRQSGFFPRARTKQ